MRVPYIVLTFALISIIGIIVISVTLGMKKCDGLQVLNGFKCIPITKCQIFNELLKRRPMSSDTLSLIKTSHCGFDKLIEKVWCPSITEKEEADPKEDNKTEIQPVTVNVGRKADPKVADEKRVTPSTVDLTPSDMLGSAALLPKTCGELNYNDKIYGGSKTDLYDYPWLAFLLYRDPELNVLLGRCGGTLISNRYVLTAAHCCITKHGKLESVILGEYHLQNKTDCFNDGNDCLPPPVTVKVESCINHVGYNLSDNESFYDDIALLRLAEPVKFDVHIKPICLPPNNLYIENSTMVAAGWGATETSTLSSEKQEVQLPYYDRQKCSNLFNRNISKMQFCAGGQRGKDTCNGDSGGPMMYLDDKTGWRVAGIVSKGATTCAQTGVPAIYTYVPEYLTWIYSQLRE